MDKQQMYMRVLEQLDAKALAEQIHATINEEFQNAIGWIDEDQLTEQDVDRIYLSFYDDVLRRLGD